MVILLHSLTLKHLDTIDKMNLLKIQISLYNLCVEEQLQMFLFELPETKPEINETR